MKTVMKKLLSLALVAILLVSAVPFQADATEAVNKVNVNVEVYLDGSHLDTRNLTVTEGETTYLNEAKAKSMLVHPDDYDFVCWKNNSGEDVSGGTLSYQWTFDATNNPEGYYLELYIKTKPAPEHKHSYTSKITTAATCTTEGVKTFTCEGTEGTCDNPTYTEPVPATGHSWGDWTKGDNNKEVRKCANCEATETRDVAAKDDTYTVTFIAGTETYTRSFVKFANVSNLPGGPDLKGYKFKGWFSGKNGTGEELVNGNKWNGEYDTYYAYYVESTDDNISTLSVYARFYIGGVQQGNTTHLYDQDFTDGESMLKWLNNNETTTSNAIFKVVSASEYEWSPRYYYNYSGNEPLTEQNLIADGDKSIVVKVYGKKATEANVLLYVHQYNSTSKKYETKSIHEMSGYTAGNTVTKSAADTIVKKNYTGKNMTITGLYSDTAWEQLLAGQNPTAANGIKVSDNGTMKVHVILKNGTASTSTSTADTTNPKTGDMIMVPVMVMLASAAAAAFVYLNSKKRAVR